MPSDRHGAAQRGDLPAGLQLAGYPAHHADELGHERGSRIGVELIRRGDLLEPALPHDADPVRHGQRLLLVVGDEQSGGAEPLLQGADLLAQLQPDLGVQGGQRLVEQQHPGLDGQRAGQGDALLLAAGELVRVLPGLGGPVQTMSSRSPARWLRWLAPILRIRSPKATLSSADMFGNKL